MLPPRDEDPYIAWRPPFPEPVLKKDKTALLVIDMQYRSAHPDFGQCAKVRGAGFKEAAGYYQSRLAVIVPNIRRLQDAFRASGMEVLHVRIQSMTANGRDRSPSHQKLGHAGDRNSREAEILDELKPAGDEMVFNKTAGSVFLRYKAEKWFRRNCNDVLGRECTAGEKGDVLAWLLAAR